MPKGDLLGVFIIFLATWIIVSIVFYFAMDDIPGKNIFSLMIGLFAGFIVCGGGQFIWHHSTRW